MQLGCFVSDMLVILRLHGNVLPCFRCSVGVMHRLSRCCGVLEQFVLIMGVMSMNRRSKFSESASSPQNVETNMYAMSHG